MNKTILFDIYTKLQKVANIMDNQNNKHGVWNIFKTSNNKAICLICIENIFLNVDISSHETLISHFVSDAHKMKVESLFEECFSKPVNYSKNQNYSEFISNLVFDTTLYLGNEPSYVSQIGSHIVCLMCSEKLFKACSKERSVDIMLFDHLKSEQHINNLKKWACWNYFFEDNSGFLMISQSRVFCSLCKQTIVVGGDSLLEVLNSHLWNKHNLDFARRVEELKTCDYSNNEQSNQNDSLWQKANGATNENGVQVHIKFEPKLRRNLEDAKDDLVLEKGFGQTQQRSSDGVEENLQVVENLHYLKGDSGTLNKSDVFVDDKNIHPTESSTDTKSNSFGNKSDYCKSRNLEDENSRVNLESSFGFHFDDVNAENKRNDDINVNESANNLFKTQETSVDIPGASSSENINDDGSESDSEPTDTEDYDDALEALTCPTCGCFVEILNEDAEFSLKLHCQIHNNLTSFNTDDKFEFNENVEYVCPICHEAIQLFNKDIELSVQHHFEERKTDHEGFGFVKSNGVSRDLLSKTFSSFTEPLKKYQKFILLKENKLLCKLCNCELPVDIKNISKILLDHLSNSFHEEQYRSLSQNLNMVVLDYNNQYQSEQPNVELDLLDHNSQQASGVVAGSSSGANNYDDGSESDIGLTVTEDAFESTSCKRKIAEEFYLDDICVHGGHNKIFGKCLKCVKTALRRLYPSKRDLKCLLIKGSVGLCNVCKEPFSMTDLNSLITSYVAHFESESHERNMNIFWRQRNQYLEDMDNKSAVELYLNDLPVCVHSRPDLMIFDKCFYCVKRALKRICPGNQQDQTYLSITKGIGGCRICNKPLCMTDLNSLITSYITHIKSESHKQNMIILEKRNHILKKAGGRNRILK